MAHVFSSDLRFYSEKTRARAGIVIIKTLPDLVGQYGYVRAQLYLQAV